MKDIIAQLQTFSTITFQWNVRFDHWELAQAIIRRGISFSRTVTHALPLEGNYETSFSKFNATTRNIVRRSKREGIVVRRTRHGADLRAYYDVHTKLASEKGNYHSLYPKIVFDELVKLHEDVIFVVAEVENAIAGGGWFFRDGDTFLYWHGAMDRKYSRQGPSYAILDYAIRMAHEEGKGTFNFGGSVGIASLEQFKSGWGAEPRYCWLFNWRNPLWQTVQNVRGFWRAHAR